MTTTIQKLPNHDIIVETTTNTAQDGKITTRAAAFTKDQLLATKVTIVAQAKTQTDRLDAMLDLLKPTGE